MNNLKFFGIALALVIATVGMTTFIVEERELAIKFRLGEIVKTDYEPGIYFQVPFVNNVKKYDSRILTMDTPAQRFLTSEKKNVNVDAFVKWRIIDAAEYYRATGGEERIAVARLSQTLNDALKDQFGSRTIKEVVSGERSEIMDVVRDLTDLDARKLGMTVVDVRIKKVDLPEEVSNSVYQRMVKERSKVAKDFRSRGEEQAKGIRANADRQRQETLAEAYRKAQSTRGSGDGEAAAIYAKAYGKDKKFYKFYRSLNAYKNTFSGNNDVMILSPDSEFFNFFKDSGGAP